MNSTADDNRLDEVPMEEIRAMINGDAPIPSVPVPSVPPVPERWGIVAQMGHMTFAGRISEEEIFGGKMGRCDVPQADGTFVTRYFTAASLYSFTPCTEEAARAREGLVRPAPSPLALRESRQCVSCDNPVHGPGVQCSTCRMEQEEEEY